MASYRKKRREPPPVFFLDRSLGRYQVARAIRDRGYVVHTMWSVYGAKAEEKIKDDRIWIRHGANQGWILLTKDDVRYAPGFVPVMEASKARVFFLSRQDLPGPVQVQWFLTNLDRIIQRSRKRGPYAWAVYEDHLIRRYP